MPHERVTQAPQQQNPIMQAVFNALDLIPQETQEGLLNSFGQGEQLQSNLINSVLNPSFDLGKINVTAPAQAASIPSSVPQPQQTIGQKPQDKKEKKEGPNKLIQFLARAGIPIGSAIAGSVNPNLLPQAAGLSTGFTSELSRQDRAREKGKGTDRDVVIFSPEGKEEGRVSIGAKDIAKFRQASPEEQAQALKAVFENIPTAKGAIETGKEVEQEFLPGAPSAKGVKDGSKLRDENNNVIAIARDGEWQSLQ